jgi:catechol 2,3-dioxygenase-like lactoylglutathione lyase family enzyme
MLVCSDLSRSRDFYRTVLGLRLLDDRSPHWIEFALASDGVTLVLHPRSELLAVRPGSLQLGFNVDNVEKFIADCATMNVPVLQYPYEEGKLKLAVISDPDGYPIQVASGQR